MNDRIVDVTALTAALRHFAEERNWERFHSPKNLVMALSVEVAELVELFQWLSEDQSRALPEDPARCQAVAHEIADVIIYATRLADKLGIDVNEAIVRKLAMNALKHPVPRQ